MDPLSNISIRELNITIRGDNITIRGIDITWCPRTGNLIRGVNTTFVNLLLLSADR